jgi:riboflavin synthase
MFTGIIKAVGRIGEIRPQGGDLRLTVRSGDLPWQDFEPGESIAVNGVCLTAVTLLADGFETDVSRETMDVTALGDIAEGSAVNLEPSLALADRLGGHLVSGHVDCVGTVKARRPDARSLRFDIELPEAYARYVARKGSICIDGVSLTINDVSGNVFSVNIIPHTAEHTIINGYEPGSRVNIEVDLVMRYLERLVLDDDHAPGLTREKLEALGYA